MSNIYDMADIWNDAGTQFSAIKMAVTNTASAAGSMFVDYRLGTAKKFSIIASDGGWNSYNAYTDESNYERIAGRWSSNQFLITNQQAGSGVARNLVIRGGHASAPGGIRLEGAQVVAEYVLGIAPSGAAALQAQFLVGTNNIMRLLGVNQSTGASFEFLEMTAPSAPGANGVRFYAEDNGAGKTRLMALFQSGAAQQVAIEPA